MPITASVTGLWTGIVAQFVPTIGTYISIILPVIVGLLSPNPWLGVIALAWAIAYQQVENLTIEPRISAKAVDDRVLGRVLLREADRVVYVASGADLVAPLTQGAGQPLAENLVVVDEEHRSGGV